MFILMAEASESMAEERHQRLLHILHLIWGLCERLGWGHEANVLCLLQGQLGR